MSVNYELTGKVKVLGETQTFGSGFQKREMVVKVEDGKFPQDINLEFVQDNIGKTESLQAGQEVTVTFDIRGREYNGRYFNSLQGWKVAVVGGSAAQPSQPTAQPEPDGFDDDTDVPF
jgi:single-strand DNA-binding protein